jgi:hypothetical protein
VIGCRREERGLHSHPWWLGLDACLRDRQQRIVRGGGGEGRLEGRRGRRDAGLFEECCAY